MNHAHDFLQALAIVLCVAAVTTVVFQRLRQPVVLGYLIAGLIVGPHVPIPLVADMGIVQTLSEIGVILLMFSLGLEFSIRKLVRVGPTAGLTALVQCSLMLWLGFVTGRAFGWTVLESLFAGALIAISSTTIIAKAFDEQGIKGPLRELVVGVLIVEDLIGILLMAVLTAISAGAGLSASAIAATTGRLALFLVALVGIGLLVVPRAIRAINRLGRAETTLIASIGICFGIALLAQKFGYSVALGAFVAGSLVAESGEEKRIEHLVEPVRDVFAAVFFVSVGMMLDPQVLLQHWVAVAVFTTVVIVGKVFGVSLGAFFTGNGVRTSVQSGLSLAQIGEFSFIIAGLGLSLGATREFLYPLAISVSAITTMSTPWLIRASGPVAEIIDRRLPKPLQTFVALYGSWLERLRAAPAQPSRGKRIRRHVRLLIIDAGLIAGIVIGCSVLLDRLSGWLQREFGVGATFSRAAIIVAAAALAVPFAAGIVRVARGLGVLLAAVAIPSVDRTAVDLGASPRRAFVVALQLSVVVLVAVPLLAVTQPFVPGAPSVLVLASILILVGMRFWRTWADLHGHVRAGAEVIVEALASAAHEGRSGTDEHALDDVRKLLPGLGEPIPVKLGESSGAIGKSLAELNLRGVTGATVLAVLRSGGNVILPTARETFRSGDVVALAGSQPAIEAARRLLGCASLESDACAPTKPSVPA